MNPSTRYRLNYPHVVHDTTGEEMVVIHRGTGYCYSLRGTGATIWLALTRGASPKEICDHLVAHAAIDRPAICAAISEFVAGLRREDLLVERTMGPDVDALPPVTGIREEFFELPRISRFSELRDVIRGRTKEP